MSRGQDWTMLGPSEMDLPSSGNAASGISLTSDQGGNCYIAFSSEENEGKALVKKYNKTTAEWELLGNAGISTGTAAFISIVASPDGTLYAAFRDETEGGKARAKRYNAQAAVWEDLGLISSGAASYLAAAVDKHGLLYVVYKDETAGNKAVVKQFNQAAGIWENVGSPTAGAVNYLSIAIAPDNVLYIAYSDLSAGGKASVRRFQDGSWQQVGAPGFSMGAASYTALAVASNNKVFVIFRDEANGGRASVLQFGGIRWEVTGTLGFSLGAVEYTSIALDEQERPYVLFKDAGLSGRAAAKRFNLQKEVWENVGSASFSGGAAAFTTIARGGDGKIYAAYRDNGFGGQALVKQLDDKLEVWENLGLSMLAGTSAAYTAAAVDKDGLLYIVYSDGGSWGKASVKYYNRQTGAWASIGKNGFSKGAAAYTSIALADDKTPYVVYQDGGVFNKAVVKRYNSSDGQWQTLGAESISDGVAGFTSIALDNTGSPWVLYQDASKAAKAVAKRYNAASSTWEIMGADGFSAGQANYISFVIDKGNTVWAAYQDAAKGNRITVKRYNSSSNVWESRGLEGFSEGIASHIAITLDNAGIPYVIYSDGSLSGRATVKRWDPAASEWKTFGNAGFSSSRAVFTAIGINDEQVIYAAYQDGSMGNRLTVRYYNTLSGIWESMAEEGVSSGAADYISLASNAGEMYVVYQDKGAGNTASVRRLANNKGVWSDAGSGNVSDGAKASYTAVRADGSGAPLLLYRDDTQGGKAVVKRYDRSAAGWETVGGAAFSEAAASCLSFSIGSNDKVFAAFSDESRGGKITVKQYDGTAWQHLGIPGFSAGSVSFTGIALDDSNNPYVIFQDKSLSRVLISRFDEGSNSWNTLGVGFTVSGDAYPALLIDKNNLIYAAFADNSRNNRITIKRYNDISDNWETLGSEGFSVGAVRYISLINDEEGTLIAAYQDESKGNKAVVKQWNSGLAQWQALGEEGISAGPAFYLSAAAGPGRQLYLIYKDSWNSGKATVKRYDRPAGRWVTAVKEGFTAGAVNYTSLFITKDGEVYSAFQDAGSGNPQSYYLNKNHKEWVPEEGLKIAPETPALYAAAVSGADQVPYVVYRDGRNNNSAVVKRYEPVSKQWLHIGGSRLSDGPVSFTSIALDQQQNPWVAYQDSSQQNRITVKRYNPTASRWEIAGKAGFSTGNAAYTAITIAANNVPYVVYQDSLAGGRLSVQGFDRSRSQWLMVGPAGFSDGAAASPAIAVAPDGVPYVVYADERYGNRATVKYYDNLGSWKTLGQSGFTSGKVAQPALVFDKQQVLHLIFVDGSQGNRITVLRYDQAEGWKPLCDPGFSFGSGTFPSLVFDEHNTAWAAYQDAANNYRLTVQRYDSGRNLWEAAGSPGFSYGTASYVSLLPGNSGHPLVIYRDNNLGGQLFMKTLRTDGENWEALNTPGLSAGYPAHFTSITADKNNIPYLIYQDAGAGKKALVKKYNRETAAWELLGGAAVSAGTAAYTAIAAVENELYAAYQDGSTGNRLTVKKYDALSSSWQSVGTEGFSKGEAYYVRIAADKSDMPYVVYQDRGNGNRITVKRLNGSQWETVGAEGFSTGTASFTSIAFTQDNIPMTAYIDAALGSKVTVKRYNGSAWETVGQPGFSMGTASYTDLLIDKNNTPYAAYIDAANGNRITVQRYDSPAGVWEIVGTVGFSTSAATSVSLALDDNDVLYAAYGDGQYVKVSYYNQALQLWETSPALSAAAGNYASLTWAGSGTFYLAFQDAGLGNQAVVKRFNKNIARWENLGDGRVSYGSTVEHAAAALDAGSEVWFISSDRSRSHKALVRKYNAHTGDWEAVSTKGFSTGSALYPAIAVGKDNVPYAAYQDGAAFRKLHVLRYNKTSEAWESMGAGLSEGVVSEISMAMDQKDQPWLVYRDASEGNSAAVKYYDKDAGQWKNAGAASAAGVSSPAITISESGVPYIIYQKAAAPKSISVKRYNSGIWESLGADVSTARGDYPAIAVDKANVVYAAYQDSLQENRITVKRYNNTSSVWETLGSEGFSPSSAAFISITVDENNNPVVMYRDGSKSGRLTAKRYNSQTKGWETIGAEGISSGMVRYTAALHHNSQLFAVYLDENAGYRVGVKQLSSSGTAWNSFGKTGISSGYTAEYTTITVDHENVPYVIYRDGKENNAATVKKYNSDAGDWEVLGRPGLSAGPASYTVIASGKKGEIYTAYADASVQNRLIVKKYNPNAPFWEDFGGSVVSGAAAKYISLKVGNDNIPCLAFQDEWNYNRITVKRYNPKSRLWTALGPEGFSDGEAGYTNLAIGAGNRVYAAYRDEANGGKATVKVYNSAAAKWETLGHEGFSSGPASYVSIAVDSSNRVYAVYRDEAEADKAAAMYYDPEAGEWQPLGTGAFTAGAASFTAVSTDQYGIPYVIYRDENAGGHLSVLRYNPVKEVWEKVGSPAFSAGAANSPSLALDNAGRPYAAYSSSFAFAKNYDCTLNVLSQPADAGICLETDAEFAVEAAGGDITYMWQVNDGKGYRYLKEDVLYSGVHSARLKINAAPGSLNSYTYRCVMIGNCVSASKQAVLTVKDFTPQLTASPPLKAVERISYKHSLSTAASGGTEPYSFQLVEGTLPPGLTLTSQGEIKGAPLKGSAGEYLFSVMLKESSACGNSSTASYTLTVDPITAELIDVVPVVTPNGDGRNDFLYIPGIEKFPENHLVIVTRNGTPVYDMRRYDNQTNPFQGKATYGMDWLPAGTYFYMLEYKADGETYRKSGYLVLKY